jgi:hypothetical protein
MTQAQRPLIHEALRCLCAVQRLSQVLRVNRAGVSNARRRAAMATRLDRLQRIVDALARACIWLCWRQPSAAPQLGLKFIRVGP